MRSGCLTKISTDYDTVEELRVLCTFAFEDQTYLLAIDEEGDYLCREIHWTPWRGTYQDTDPVSDEAIRIGDMLLEKGVEKPSFYLFRGEHYGIRREAGVFRIKKCERLEILSPRAGIIPFCARLGVTVLFALIYGAFCVKTGEINIASSIFGALPREKLILLIFLIQVAGAIVLFLIRRSSRGLADLYFYGIIPYNTVALIGVCRTSGEVRGTVIAVLALSFALWILPKVIQALRAKRKPRKIKCWKDALRRCYAPFLICLCIAYASIHYLGVPMYTYTAVRADSGDGQAESAMESARGKLQSEAWAACGEQEKLDVLQVICDYECARHLGCPSPRVVAGYPDSETTYGSYNRESDTITINVEHLKEDAAADVLDTLLHEARHAYQHAAVEALAEAEESLSEETLALACFQTVYAYRDNFDNYVSGLENYLSYRAQAVESDSRAWAQERITEEYRYYLYPDGEPSGSARPAGGMPRTE